MIFDPGDPVVIDGVGPASTVGIVDGDEVWVLRDGGIEPLPTERLSLHPKAVAKPLNQRQRRLLWQRVYKRMRDRVIAEAGRACVRCGARNVIVHHRAGRWHPLANVPRHLAVLCEPCHGWVHSAGEDAYKQGWLIHEAEVA